MVRERFPGIRHNLLLRRCEQLSFAPMFAASDIAAARANLRSVGKAAPCVQLDGVRWRFLLSSDDVCVSLNCRAVADSPGADEVRYQA